MKCTFDNTAVTCQLHPLSENYSRDNSFIFSVVEPLGFIVFCSFKNASLNYILAAVYWQAGRKPATQLKDIWAASKPGLDWPSKGDI